MSAVPLLVVTGVLMLMAITALADKDSRAGGSRERLFDLYQRLSPAEATTTPSIHLVKIDSETTAKVGPWPWPRSYVADLVEKTRAAGAAGVIYLEPVDAPDPLSPETIGAFWLDGARDDILAEQLSLLPSTDKLLAEAFVGPTGDQLDDQTLGAIAVNPGGVATHAEALRLGQGNIDRASWTLLADGADSDFLTLPVARERFPVSPVLKDSVQTTVTALPVDEDGVFRTPPLIWTLNNSPTPLAALEAARMAKIAAAPTGTPQNGHVVLDPASTAVTNAGRVITGATIGDVRFNLDRYARTRLYWPRQLALPTTPAWHILEDRASLSAVKNKVVIIGLDDEIGGVVRTARGDLTPLDVHGLIAQQLVDGAQSKRPGWVGYVEGLGILLLGAGAVMWSQKLTFWRAIALSAFLAMLTFAGSAAAFSFGRLLIDPTLCAAALFLGAFTVAGGRSLGAALQDDVVRGNFKGALPEQTMKKLREEGAGDILEGARREITILACELRLLDSDQEKLAGRPGDATGLIAASANALRKSLVEMGASVDQADGGKIYAYFNAPLETADHKKAACSNALRLVESMDKINLELEASPHTRDVQLHLAIGIASGECFVGPMGHGKSKRYSAVGRAIETAAFLRRQAEFYGPAIICDEEIYRKTNHNFAFLELDRLKPRGATRAFTVYALVGNPFIKSSKGFRALDDAHRQMLTSYRTGDFLAAKAHLGKARQSPGSKIALFDIYESRINAKLHDDPDEWDGVVDVTI